MPRVSKSGCHFKVLGIVFFRLSSTILPVTFSSIGTGVSVSARNEITGNHMLCDEHMTKASRMLSDQFFDTIDGLSTPLGVKEGEPIKKEDIHFYSKVTDKDYVQILNNGRSHWVTAIFKKGKKEILEPFQ
jgi:uncharacterized protein (UPF0254 family)